MLLELRTTLAGWVFVAVLVGVWGAGGHPYFLALVEWVRGDINVSQLLLAGFVGLSGPPVFGFLLYSFLNMLWEAIPDAPTQRKWSRLVTPWGWSSIYREAAEKIRMATHIAEGVSDAALVHALMYQWMSPQLRSFRSDRRTEFHIMATCVVAAGCAAVVLISVGGPYTRPCGATVAAGLSFVACCAWTLRGLRTAARVYEVTRAWILVVLPRIIPEDLSAPADATTARTTQDELSSDSTRI